MLRCFIALLAVCALVLSSVPAFAAFESDPGVCETTTTTGTGTLNLSGTAATGGYVKFVDRYTSGASVSYQLSTGTGASRKIEVGTGVFTDGAPDTLTRATVEMTTDVPAGGTPLTLAAGTHTVCTGPNPAWFQLGGGDTSWSPNTNDGAALGTTALKWSDLHLASGSVVNFDNGDVTLTHAANDIFFQGGNLTMGHTANLSIFYDGETDAPLEVLGTGADASIGIGRWTASANAGRLNFAHSRGATVGSNGIVVSGDSLGDISWVGDDTNSFAQAALIRAEVDGTPSDGTDMPGRIRFSTTPDGTGSSTARMAILNDGGVVIGGGTTSPGAEDLSLEGGDIEFGNAGTAGTDTTLTRSAAGELTLEGDAVKHAGKQTIWVPAGAMVQQTTNGCVSATNETATNDVMYLTKNCDTTTQEGVQFQVAFPKNWNSGTLSGQVFWSHPSTVTNFGVEFDFACLFLPNDGALDQAFGTAVEVGADTGGTTDDIYVTAETGAVQCAGTEADDGYVTVRVRRVPADAGDNLAVDARIHGVKLFFTDDASSDD